MAQGSAFGPMDGADGADGAEGFENLDLLGSGGRRSVFRPVGIAPEMARRANENDYRSSRWPPRLPGAAWPPGPNNPWPTAPGPIPRRLTDFTPDNASLLVLAQFVQLKAQDPNNNQPYDAWTRLLTQAEYVTETSVPNSNPPVSNLQAELAELRLLAKFRPGAMAEALAQRNGIIGYFRGLLHFTVATHPHTYYLAAAALRVGQFLCMHYKGVFNRPRPIRIDPSLLSQIDPPGHSSYPSGHATQAFLIALCLQQVVPTALGTGIPNGPSPYWLLAQRIAKLREVLGVHYPSDTAAGQRLGERAFPLLLKCPLVAGTAGPDNDNDGVPDNQLPPIAGEAVYSNGWLGIARREWEPR